MCISMNAADERSLETIRQKIFPFLRASWNALSLVSSTKPRFIILDECETLTEAAQLSLQTILDKDPKEVCVILFRAGIAKLIAAHSTLDLCPVTALI